MILSEVDYNKQMEYCLTPQADMKATHAEIDVTIGRVVHVIPERLKNEVILPYVRCPTEKSVCSLLHRTKNNALANQQQVKDKDRINNVIAYGNSRMVARIKECRRSSWNKAQ